MDSELLRHTPETIGEKQSESHLPTRQAEFRRLDRVWLYGTDGEELVPPGAWSAQHIEVIIIRN